jgi:hypothetical protein
MHLKLGSGGRLDVTARLRSELLYAVDLERPSVDRDEPEAVVKSREGAVWERDSGGKASDAGREVEDDVLFD